MIGSRTSRRLRCLAPVALMVATAGCAPPDPCADLMCVGPLPAIVEGTTVGSPRDAMSAYGCTGSTPLDGAEVVHRVTLPEAGWLVAATDDGSHELRLLDALDPATCLDAHPRAVAAYLSAGEHYVVVDSTAGGEGAYSLRMALSTEASFAAHGMSPALAADALTVIARAWAWGATRRTEYVVVDFTLHSAQPREWVLDLSTGALLHHLRVAHGRRSTDGADLAHAVTFSNEPGSNQSSLGLYRSAGPYVGTYGPSFRLEGLEPGWNDEVCARDIVMHPWAPLGDEYVDRCGWARPSLGCPAIDSTLSMPVRELLARPDGTTLDAGVAMLFWYPGTAWHAGSPYLHDSAPSATVLSQMTVECDSSADGTPEPPASGDYDCD